MEKPDFFYMCLVCKESIPATWDNIDPAGMQSVTIQLKPGMTETTFRCEKHHEPEDK